MNRLPRLGAIVPTLGIAGLMLSAAPGAQAPVPAPATPAATLVGFARLPADTFAPGPPAGVFRDNGARGTGFSAQPVQGASAMRPDPLAPGWWMVLSDNGFGVRWNSPDYLLCLYRMRPSWKTESGGAGTIEVGEIVRLSDPGRHVPFRIVREDTPERWLTGSDFDPESFVQMTDGTLWIGDEFGPFLLHTDAAGRVLAPPAGVPGLVSPDRPGLPPPDAGRPNDVTVRRSRGFEALAASPDGSRLFAMLEGPTTEDPVDQARILEFDPTARVFTGREWRYRLEAPGYSATELVNYAPERFLVIERDAGHGPSAALKKVFAIRLGEAGGVVEKAEVADLLNIADSKRLGGQGVAFTFPFITTEAIWPEDERTLVLSNDNNFPATGGRQIDQRDGTEFIRVRLARPLR